MTKQNGVRKVKGRYTERLKYGPLDVRVSGKKMVLANNRSPAEHRRFVESHRKWRSQADAEFKARRDALLEVVRPYRALSLLGYVYFKETTANPETYKEWEHKGLAAKVEHFALLLSSRAHDGAVEIVPVEVSAAVDQYLSYLFTNLSPYYEDIPDGGSPTDPNPRSLVLMWELMVRMPLYPWQHRGTLASLFDPINSWMKKSLGFTIRDALAVDLAFETCTNEVLAAEVPALLEGMAEMRQVLRLVEGGIEVNAGYEEEHALRLYNEFQARWSSVMARIGSAIALDVDTIAKAASLSVPSVSAVLDFFTMSPSQLQADYAIPVPDSPLKLKPFLKFEKRWALPSSVLFLPAMQPALERALNPDLHAARADKSTWNIYENNRADLLESRTVAALSSLLGGSTVYRNVKYKTAPGQSQPYELDGLAIHDGKVFLVECKAGAFSSTAKRGDVDAIEGRIGALMTDAHEQAIRALEYIESDGHPTFRSGREVITIDKASIDDVFLITTTLEELGYLAARFNEVDRLATTALKQTPWLVSLHDLELAAKYIVAVPEFIHFLGRRISLNREKALGAFDELDWLGRYFYDGLALSELKEHLASDPMATGSLISHRTEIDDYEHYENGFRMTSAPRPESCVHDTVKKLCRALANWGGPGYVNAAIVLLDLPAKLQRAFAKRVTQGLCRAKKNQVCQEEAISKDGSAVFVCSICGSDTKSSEVRPTKAFGKGRRNIHVIVDHDLGILNVEIA